MALQVQGELAVVAQTQPRASSDSYARVLYAEDSEAAINEQIK